MLWATPQLACSVSGVETWMRGSGVTQLSTSVASSGILGESVHLSELPFSHLQIQRFDRDGSTGFCLLCSAEISASS